MRKNIFIYLNGSMYILVEDERLVPANKIAARVSLTADNFKSLMNQSWKEYQSLLEHYFDIGQKLVTA
jgi:hypothetical protein